MQVLPQGFTYRPYTYGSRIYIVTTLLKYVRVSLYCGETLNETYPNFKWEFPPQSSVSFFIMYFDGFTIYPVTQGRNYDIFLNFTSIFFTDTAFQSAPAFI